MKRYFRWLLDPCFHLFVIGVVLFQLGVSLGAFADPGAEEPAVCARCSLAHGQTLVCPMSLAKVITPAR